MNTVEVTSSNLESTLEGPGIVLLDFWAPWCGPCRMFGPVFESSAGQHTDIKFGKVNTDDEQQLASELGIRSIPTIMAFKDGVLVFEQAGALPAPTLEKLIEQLRALDMDEVRKKIAEQRGPEAGGA